MLKTRNETGKMTLEYLSMILTSLMRGRAAFSVEVPFLSWLRSLDWRAFSKAELVPEADRRRPELRPPEAVE